jgi:hypothetical protein
MLNWVDGSMDEWMDECQQPNECIGGLKKLV